MGTIKNFEDLEIWKISRELVNLIYSDLRKCHDFAFKDQITRAGISSMNNIAEGFCRNSDTEFKQFLNIALGSLAELETQVIISCELAYIAGNVKEGLLEATDHLTAMIISLSKKM